LSKAYECNMCKTFHSGPSDMQIGHSEEMERLLSYRLEIKFSPDSKEGNFYIKDLCPSCAELICCIWKNPAILKKLLLVKKAVRICSRK
jgi:hypothetical protein